MCTVSEPGEEGRELEEGLRAQGLTTELVNDEDAGHAVETVNLLLVGADTVFRDGSLINKTGTRDLTRRQRPPPECRCSSPARCQARARRSTRAGEDRFDLTPPECVDWYVTEEGVFAPADIPACSTARRICARATRYSSNSLSRVVRVLGQSEAARRLRRRCTRAA